MHKWKVPLHHWSESILPRPHHKHPLSGTGYKYHSNWCSRVELEFFHLFDAKDQNDLNTPIGQIKDTDFTLRVNYLMLNTTLDYYFNSNKPTVNYEGLYNRLGGKDKACRIQAWLSFFNGMCYRSCHLTIFKPFFSVTPE